ncbi:hypothetical protein V1478_003322 [Vespula squamosa]|uniref:Uncharacterized protein n=1 Tax=Vespula squamosa TaxID=30214 RepID=A0ABD2BQD4_VESSQ
MFVNQCGNGVLTATEFDINFISLKILNRNANHISNVIHSLNKITLITLLLFWGKRFLRILMQK